MLEIQKKVKKLYFDNGWKTDPALLLLAMQKEFGELVGNIPAYKKNIADTDSIPEEIEDLVSLILAFCNTLGIDFEECVQATIKNVENKKSDSLLYCSS